MPRKSISRRKAAQVHGPDVIVYFVFDRGLLFISIKNIGDQPAFAVRVQFSPRLMGIGGTKEVSALPLFHKLEFLPPQKEIVTFFDTSASYFGSGQATDISARISARDSNGASRVVTIRHNLEIYREIGYIDGHES
jgi:hypothetical protein